MVVMDGTWVRRGTGSGRVEVRDVYDEEGGFYRREVG